MSTRSRVKAFLNIGLHTLFIASMISVILNVVGMVIVILCHVFYNAILQYPSFRSLLYSCRFIRDDLGYFFVLCTPIFLIVLLVFPISIIILAKRHNHNLALIWGLLLAVHEIAYLFLFFGYVSRY